LAVPALPSGVAFTAVAAAANTSLALCSDGNIRAWGDNTRGHCNVVPLGPGQRYVQVTAGPEHVAALRSDGQVACWGLNQHGQCNPLPLPPGLVYVEVRAGQHHTAARRSDGSIVVWGDNASRQCDVPPLPPGRSCWGLAGGTSHTAALVRSGSFETFGAGCAGSLPAARLEGVQLPRLGQTLQVAIDQLPTSTALMALGFDNVAAPFGPLPFALGIYGMPGCELRVRIDDTRWLAGAANAATYSLAIPNAQVLAGFVFHLQALVFDPFAGNTASAVMSDAATVRIGP
jgi:hypothetical protein